MSMETLNQIKANNKMNEKRAKQKQQFIIIVHISMNPTNAPKTQLKDHKPKNGYV